MRAILLASELLDTPALIERIGEKVDRLVQENARVAETVARLGDYVRSTTENLKGLSGLVQSVEQSMIVLSERMDQLTARVDTLAEMTQAHSERLGKLIGAEVERKVRENPAFFLGQIPRLQGDKRKPQTTVTSGLSFSAGYHLSLRPISSVDFTRIQNTDLVIELHKAGSLTGAVLVEASATVGKNDVERVKAAAAY